MLVRIILATLSALVTACAATSQPPEVNGYQSPASQTQGIRDTHHDGVIGDYTHRTPVDPRPWRRLNEEQAPNRDGTS